MRPPNLFCVGAQKAGTTTLYELLRRSPEISFSDHKECHFFDQKNNFSKGIDWYCSLFSGADKQRFLADFTPDYLPSRFAAERIKNMCGSDVRIIILLRHPVDRAYSQFNFYRLLRAETSNDFCSVLDDDKVRYIDQWLTWHTPAGYVLRSLYYEACARFLEVFSPERVLLLQFEELVDSGSRVDVIRRLRSFLGLADFETLPDIHANRTNFPANPVADRIIGRLRPISVPLKELLSVNIYEYLKNHAFDLLLDKPKAIDLGLRSRLFMRFFYRDSQLCQTIDVPSYIE